VIEGMNKYADNLCSSEERYRKLFENSPLGIFQADDKGIIVDCNDNFVKIIGSSRQALIGLNIHSLPDTKLVTEFKKSLSGEAGFYEDVYHSVSVDKATPVKVHFAPIFADNGRIQGCMGIVEDVTQKKLDEEEIHKNARRLSEINHCLLGLGQDFETNIQRLTALCGDLLDAACALYNRLESGLLCSMGQWQAPEDYDPRDHPQGHICYDAIKQGQNETMVVTNLDQTEYARTDPNVRRYNLKTYLGHPVKCGEDFVGTLCVVYQENRVPTEDDKKVIGIIASALSAEEDRRQAREDLVRSQESFKRLAEQCPISIMQFDSQGRLIFVNEWHMQHFAGNGVDKQKLLGMHIQELPGLVKAGINEQVGRILKGEHLDVPEIFFPEFIGGGCGWVSLRGVPLKEGDKITGGILIREDLTAWKKTEQELVKARQEAEAASRVKTEFLANMSHEIRTPLNGIAGMLQLLKETSLDMEQKEYVDLGIKSSHRLTRLLSDILDLSRIEAGHMTIHQEEFDPLELCSSVNELFAVTTRNKHLSLECIFQEGFPSRLVGDEARIQQILFNLVGNALKFTEKGGVQVSWSLYAGDDTEQQVRITVQDTGIGMEQEVLQELFKPFVQAENSYTRKYQGAGLGLSIVKRLVELMHGNISVKSVPGQGSTFYVDLPLKAAEDSDVSRQEDSQDSEKALSGLRILLVEDDPANRFAMQKLLQKSGHHVQTAQNGSQAVEAFARSHFDCIFMDIHMPVMDGVQATRKIRSMQDSGIAPKVPIIALTAYTLNGDREKFLESGMDEYLGKPVQMQDIENVLKKLLG